MGKSIPPSKENGRDTLINGEPSSTHNQSARNGRRFLLFFFFPLQPKSVYRGKEGNLGNQRYGVKAAEHEGGSYDTGCTPLPSVSPKAPPPTYRNIVYSWKDPPTESVVRNNGN